VALGLEECSAARPRLPFTSPRCAVNSWPRSLHFIEREASPRRDKLFLNCLSVCLKPIRQLMRNNHLKEPFFKKLLARGL